MPQLTSNGLGICFTGAARHFLDEMSGRSILAPRVLGAAQTVPEPEICQGAGF